MSTAFANEPILELRRASVRAGLQDALAELDARLPLRVGAGEGLVSTDPGDPDRVVALARMGTADDARAAVGRAAEAAPGWAATPAARRAEIVRGAAAVLRRRRLEVAALEVREAAKPWAEADADVCEAIDFLEYYARGAVALAEGAHVFQAPGERNAMRYAPRGVTAVIAPWNFPVAIATGMTSAAIATGNTVVLKPAEQTPGCAGVIAEAFAEAGLPDGVLTLLSGEAEAGRALVEDPRVHQIAFTGSLPVGLGIVEAAARTREGQTHIKRVIAELGGKNCAIVDADADLDDAVPDLMASAFGFAGQKCSAISRVLVHEAIAETLLERLHGAVRTLDVGPAERLGIDVPPVIDEEARDRVRGYAEAAAAHGTVVAAGEVPDHGWYVAPTIASALPGDADVLRQEVFGPLLAVTPVPSVAAACDVVDSLPYALTGALFSRNPDVVERVVAASPVGNLYVNRGSTGAMVGRQPFGGNRLSGTGTKAGGPDYLLSFVEPRVVTENTVRHGLVV